MKEDTNKMNGMTLLKQAKKHDGQFVIEEFNEILIEMAASLRESPQNKASLNINVELRPASGDGQMITAHVKIANVKIPKPETKPIHAWISTDGKMTRNDPSQTEMFDESVEVNEETGEITKIDGKKGHITKIK